MTWDKIKLSFLFIRFLVPFSFNALYQLLASVVHRWTYQSVENAQNVIVIGGSFAGVELTRRLAESLPTGYRVVLIERNSHLNYSFNFPRYSVLQGHERKAFIPYDGIGRRAPERALKRICDAATRITEDTVRLSSGEEIRYSYLVIATGSWQPFPSKLQSQERESACAELHKIQEAIRDADNIAIIGGGAVGVELAADIKSYYPQKDVTLIHSRDQLLPRFGPRLHSHVMKVLDQLGVHTILQQRPATSDSSNGGVVSKGTLKFSNGDTQEFDLIVSTQVVTLSHLEGCMA